MKPFFIGSVTICRENKESLLTNQDSMEGHGHVRVFLLPFSQISVVFFFKVLICQAQEMIIQTCMQDPWPGTSCPPVWPTRVVLPTGHFGAVTEGVEMMKSRVK